MEKKKKTRRQDKSKKKKKKGRGKSAFSFYHLYNILVLISISNITLLNCSFCFVFFPSKLGEKKEYLILDFIRRNISQYSLYIREFCYPFLNLLLL